MCIQEDIALELSRLEREALDRARRRNADLQFGEAWIGLVDRELPEGPETAEA